jgi:hypothetical protein
MDGATVVPPPRNEPPFSYAPGSAERSALLAELLIMGILRTEPSHV